MKKRTIISSLIVLVSFVKTFAQCSICTKTASQLGDGPAQGLNTAIVYLMFTPLAIMGIIGYRWWKKEQMQ